MFKPPLYFRLEWYAPSSSYFYPAEEKDPSAERGGAGRREGLLTKVAKTGSPVFFFFRRRGGLVARTLRGSRCHRSYRTPIPLMSIMHANSTAECVLTLPRAKLPSRFGEKPLKILNSLVPKMVLLRSWKECNFPRILLSSGATNYTSSPRAGIWENGYA